MSTPSVQPSNATSAKKPWYKKWWGIALIAVVVLAIFSAVGGGKKDDAAPATGTSISAEAPADAKTTAKAPSTTADNVPAEYKAALKKAGVYASKMHMSKSKLYTQLTSDYGEKFSPDAAQYAVDNVKADWNANALAQAKDYQNKMSMSPKAIHDQLVSDFGEGFTEDEAQYAVSHL